MNLSSFTTFVKNNITGILLGIVIFMCIITLIVGMTSDAKETVSYSNALSWGAILTAVTGATILIVHKIANKKNDKKND